VLINSAWWRLCLTICNKWLHHSVFTVAAFFNDYVIIKPTPGVWNPAYCGLVPSPHRLGGMKGICRKMFVSLTLIWVAAASQLVVIQWKMRPGKFQQPIKGHKKCHKWYFLIPAHRIVKLLLLLLLLNLISTIISLHHYLSK